MGAPDHPGIASRIFRLLADSEVYVDMIVQNVSTGEHPLTDVSFTLDESQGTLAMNLLRAAEEKIGYTRLDYNSEVGKLSLVGAGMKTNTGVAFQFFQALADANINVDMISTSEVRISIVTSVDKLDEAVRAVHTAFDLDSSDCLLYTSRCV